MQVTVACPDGLDIRHLAAVLQHHYGQVTVGDHANGIPAGTIVIERNP